MANQTQSGAALPSHDLFDVGLSDAERERLALLLEECGEVQQIIGKILRHGYESTHPDGGPTNRELLEKELGDIQCAEAMMTVAGDIRGIAVSSAFLEKQEKVGRYLHFQSNSVLHRCRR